jgi:hypothetical protein
LLRKIIYGSRPASQALVLSFAIASSIIVIIASILAAISSESGDLL